KAEFGFILATEDATWTHDSLKRSLFIQITGPQTHQAAQSYAEKAFLRSLFKIPTGDMDLDSLPQAETEEAQIALVNGNGKRKSSAAAKRDGTTETFNEIRKRSEERRGGEECRCPGSPDGGTGEEGAAGASG